MTTEPASPTSGSRLALAVLVVLVVLSPWPFGSAHPRTTQAIAVVCLATSLAVVLWDWRLGGVASAHALLWPLLGLWALALLQLVPLPGGLLHLLAPGPAEVWYPAEPVAAAVLGDGPHPISVYPEATRRWLAFVTGVVALGLLAAPALRDRRNALRASIAIVGGGLLVAVYGLVARLLFGDKLYGVFAVPTVAPFGPFVSKNHFAGYIEMAALLAVGLAAGLADEARRGPGWLDWMESRRVGWIVAAWGVAGALILAVPVSLSRGGVVSLAAGLAAFALIRAWLAARIGLSLRVVVLILVALAGAGVGLFTLLPDEARGRILSLTGVTTERSGAYRLTIWRDTLHLAATSPIFGSGLGAYEDAIPRFKTTAGDLRVQHAENDYVEVLAEGGLVGAALITVLVTVVLIPGLRGIRDETHRLRRGLQAGALAAIVCMLVHSAFDFNLRIPSNGLLAVVAAALLPVPLAPPARPLPLTRAPWRRLLLAVALAAGSVAAVATVSEEQRLETGPLRRVASEASTGLRRRSLQETVEAHLRRRPADAEAWLALGWLRLFTSRAEADSLARRGIGLDPTNQGLRVALERWRSPRP
jgi:O-antigen ligase